MQPCTVFRERCFGTKKRKEEKEEKSAAKIWSYIGTPGRAIPRWDEWSRGLQGPVEVRNLQNTERTYIKR